MFHNIILFILIMIIYLQIFFISFVLWQKELAIQWFVQFINYFVSLLSKLIIPPLQFLWPLGMIMAMLSPVLTLENTLFAICLNG